MAEILTREEYEDFLHRAFSNIRFELDNSGQLVNTSAQPFNRVLAHDAALRAENTRLRETMEEIADYEHVEQCEGGCPVELATAALAGEEKG